jgi:hypothetical protein
MQAIKIDNLLYILCVAAHFYILSRSILRNIRILSKWNKSPV